MLGLNMEFRKGIFFLRLNGELTRFTYVKLLDYILPIIKNKGIKYIVINLSGIKLIDNVGKNALKSIIKEVKKNKGKGLICNTKTIFDDNVRVVKNELIALTLLKV